MKCYQCGSEMRQDPVTKRIVCPRCDYWKPSYEALWGKHKENVEHLEQQINQRFPEVSNSRGLGAGTEVWLDIPPDYKNEPDLKLWFKYNNFADIEVSGSDAVTLGPYTNIWLLPGKLDAAVTEEEKGHLYWFYMVYKNKTVVLTPDIVKPYKNNIIEPTIRGKRERYIAIPAKDALPKDILFEWISAELERLKTN